MNINVRQIRGFIAVFPLLIPCQIYDLGEIFSGSIVRIAAEFHILFGATGERCLGS